MIAKPNIQKSVKRRKVARLNHQQSQMIINAVLYRIIMENAEDEEKDAILTIPMTELENVPVNFGLEVSKTKESVMIKATVTKPKPKIITPELYCG